MTEIDAIIPLIEYDIEEGNHISWYHAKILLEHINSLITTIESLQGEIASHAPDGRNYTNGQYVDLLLKFESQKEEIKRLMGVNQHLEIEYAEERAAHNSHVTELIRSQSITELTVKENDRLKKIQQMLVFNEDFQKLTPMKKFSLAVEMMADSYWENDSEIKRLTHGN